MTAREAIEAEPTVMVRIPNAPPGTDPDMVDQVIQVQVNGVHMQIRRGDTVEMPTPLYLALRETGRHDYL